MEVPVEFGWKYGKSHIDFSRVCHLMSAVQRFDKKVTISYLMSNLLVSLLLTNYLQYSNVFRGDDKCACYNPLASRGFSNFIKNPPFGFNRIDVVDLASMSTIFNDWVAPSVMSIPF